VLSLIGLMAGALSGLLGIGGGAVLVPALVLLGGFGQKTAQGASLWYVVPTALFAGVLYSQQGELDIRLSYVAAMVAAAFLGAAIGARLVRRIRQRQLKQVFGVALVLIAGIMIWRSTSGNIVAIYDNPNLQYLVLTWTGLVAGFLSGLLGIGGGVLVVPALVLMGAFGQKAAQGLSLLYIVPTGLFGALLYRYHVKVMVNPLEVAFLIGAGVLGAYGGCSWMWAIPEHTLRIVFAIALALTGVLIVIRAARERTPTPENWVI
jgi:hypothetical protein